MVLWWKDTGNGLLRCLGLGELPALAELGLVYLDGSVVVLELDRLWAISFRIACFRQASLFVLNSWLLEGKGNKSWFIRTMLRVRTPWKADCGSGHSRLGILTQLLHIEGPNCRPCYNYAFGAQLQVHDGSAS